MKRGFSLIELMVVVAIIGILATIAIPNYQKFQKRARQSSAKSELSGLYTAEKAFFAEYSTYAEYLPLIGFVPDGSSCPGLPTVTVISWDYSIKSRYYMTGFDLTGDCDVTWPTNLPQNPNTVGIIENCTQFRRSFNPNLSTSFLTILEGDFLSGGMFCNASSFKAVAAGIIGGNPLIVDIWSINENRVLRNERSGL